ncbi:GPW/gp25 family protein [Dyadobacter sp. MSC1_007]|jgi:phage baseplate assembly protein W|uniref:GPW/gp25 family protein n=1 Tax=Dyadobacter sp. MSC1_007 TaxID=2909264 RepID=UPI00202F972D|nr:GPW/gp25 family protein [Dyadobacter sp. MSC1_007]
METNALYTAPERKSFLGTGWSFPPQFSKQDCNALMVSDEEDIWQSLQILFSTSLRERRITPDYGCSLENYVYAAINTSLLSLLEEMLKEGIQVHEPRIKLDRLDINALELEGRLDILVSYTIRSTNTRFNKVYPYYYQEGTNVDI